MTNVNKKIYAKNPNNFAFVVKSNKDLISIGEESQSRIIKNKIKKMRFYLSKTI